jgi:acylphosphatase
VGAVARRVVVHGRVQGVGFRYSVQARARSRGVSGWVANRSDGSVEALFEGEPDAVAALVDFSREGPRGAEVEDVEVAGQEPQGLAGFEVR